METETQRAGRETAAHPQMCPSCGAALVEGMRFCRSCGYRLGEGMAEYVETVRFDRLPDASRMAEGNQAMTGAAGAPTTVIAPFAQAQPQSSSPGRRRRKGRKWLAFLLMFLLFIPLAALGGRFLFRTMRDVARQNVGRFQPQPDRPRSFFGAEEFGDMEGAGAIVEGAMPNSPAERAGLLDGDIVTSFDGKAVNGEDAMRDLLRETPIGKTVEVVYVRDGETKTTKLTTISSEDYDSDAVMPKERGLLGIDSDEAARVPIEGTKFHGVRLGEVYPNRPADLAGLKEGDIVVEFDGKPVRTPEGLNGHINFAKPGSTVPVVFYRDGQRMKIDVKMGRRA